MTSWSCSAAVSSIFSLALFTVHETASVPPANYDAAQFEQEEARLMSKILAVLPASFVGSCETNLITTVCGYIGELSKRVSELASAETVDSVTTEINAVHWSPWLPYLG